MMKYGFGEFTKNIIINTIIILLLSVVLLICIFMTSAVGQKAKKYNQFKSDIEKKGYVLVAEYEYILDNKLCREIDDLKAYVPEAETIYGTYVVGNTVCDDKRAYAIAYDREIIERFKPVLKEGNWFTGAQNQSDYLQVVVSEKSGYHVGDVIKLESENNSAQTELVVIGVLGEFENIFHFNGFEDRKYDYRDLYCPYEYFYYYGEETPFFIFAYDDVKASGITEGEDETSFLFHVSGSVMVIYPDDISEDAMEASFSRILGSGANSEKLSDIKAGSERYLYAEVLRILPILILLCIFIIITVIGSTLVSVRQNMKRYALFNIVGLSWKRCGNIHFAASVLNAIATIFVTMFVYLFCKNMGVLENTAVYIGRYQILASAAVLCLYMLMAYVTPFFMFSKMNIKNILNEKTD